MDLPIETIVAHGGVTPAYARMLRAGSRQPSLSLALALYDGTGKQVGPLTGLTKREIETARKMAA
jgi:hypothetical protein